MKARNHTDFTHVIPWVVHACHKCGAKDAAERVTPSVVTQAGRKTFERCRECHEPWHSRETIKTYE